MTPKLLAAFIVVIAIISCKNSKHLQFDSDLGKDTVVYKGYVFPGNTTMASILGPYHIKFKDKQTDARRKDKLVTGINELSEVQSFRICKGDYCANASTSYYTKQKTTDIHLVQGDPGLVKIKSQKIYGTIVSAEDTLNYEINIQKSGNGYCRLPGNKVASIRPLNRHTGFGKIVNGVGLEYVIDGKAMGAFTQKENDIVIALNKNLDERTRLCLTALSICLNNNLNMISIL